MNQKRAPNFRRLAIFAAALIILSSVMIFWGHDVIREVIVLPLSYIFWVLGIIVRVTPQIFFWIVLLLIAIQIAWRALVVTRKAPRKAGPYLDDVPSPTSGGRAAYWDKRVSLMRTARSGYYANTFHSALSRLALDTLSYRYRQPVRVIENQLKANTLNVPPEVRDYLLSHEERQEGTYRGFFGELWQNLVDFALDSWARITTGQKARPAPVDPQVAFILNYLEEELEVSHDDSGQ